MFYKKMFLENFVKFTGKYLCQILFLNKVSGLLRHRCFPVNFAKLLTTLFLVKISGGHFFQIPPNLKRIKTEQFKNE